MDVLNKFKSTLTSSVSSTVFSTVSTIKDVLPGNPVTREYEINEHIASAGPGLLWKVFSGVKKSTKQSAAVFVLEKRSLESKYPGNERRNERERILDQFKKSISQLTRLRHPQVLTVQFPLEESRDCLAFATEPVFASLANLLGQHENLPTPVPSSIRDYKMFDVEIKYGLLQLCEGLTFLHDSVKLLHRNLSPQSIVLNEAGAWKIFGFDFALNDCNPNDASPKWRCTNFVESVEDLMPDLDFLAPEYAMEDDDLLSPASDMFSIGMLAFTLHNSKPLFTNSSWSTFRRNASELKSLRESNLQLIPSDLKETLKLLLNSTPGLRPTASECSKVHYFEDVGVKTLANLDAQFQWDNLQKSQFYKGLPHVLPRLPQRVCIHRVVPCLAKEFVNATMVPFVLPSVLAIAEEASAKDFVAFILPLLKPVMKLTDPIQILLIFMQRMEMLLSKTPATDVKSDVLPMIYRALESDTAQIQELCLSIIPGFAGLLEFQAIKTALLPRIKKLILQTTLLSVRVNGLICLGKLLPHLDKWLVMDEILPVLQQVPSREPAVIMASIGILKLTLAEAKLGMTKEVIASKVLPYLFPLSIENGLSVAQYAAVMALIRELIDRVEEEHRAKLEQLSNLQNEQRSALQISMAENNQLKAGQLIPDSQGGSSGLDHMFNGLGLDSYIGKKDTGSLATNLLSSKQGSLSTSSTGASSKGSSGGPLSLAEKQKILRESQVVSGSGLSQQKGHLSGQLKPSMSGTYTSKPNAVGTANARDLTASLMEANVKQMKQSQTFSNFNSRPNQSKPIDLSAFDSLLPSSNGGNGSSRMPMNSLMSHNLTATATPQSNVMSFTTNSSNSQVVKSLTASDISDLLS